MEGPESQDPLGYVLTEIRRVSGRALRQDNECILLTILGKCKLLLIFLPDGY